MLLAISILLTFIALLILYLRTKGDLYTNGKFTKRGYKLIFCGTLAFIFSAISAYVKYNEEDKNDYEKKIEKEWELFWNTNSNKVITTIVINSFSDVESDIILEMNILSEIKCYLTEYKVGQPIKYEFYLKNNGTIDFLENYNLIVNKNENIEYPIDSQTIQYYKMISIDSIRHISKDVIGNFVNNSFSYFDKNKKWTDPNEKINGVYLQLNWNKDSYNIAISDFFRLNLNVILPEKIQLQKYSRFYILFFTENFEFVYTLNLKDFTIANSKISGNGYYSYQLSGSELYNLIYNTTKKNFLAMKRLGDDKFTKDDYKFLFSLGIAPNNHMLKSIHFE